MVEWAERALRRVVPAFGHDDIAPALAGDIGAARGLICSAHNPDRPDVVLVLYLAGVAGFPTALADCWNHDHRHMLKRFSRRTLREMFLKGGTRPIDISARYIDVWRGGFGPIERLQRGWSWTTDRGVAAFFIEYWQQRLKDCPPPLVIKARVAVSRVVHTDNCRQEHEVVIFGARNASVDGTPDEWKRWADARAPESAEYNVPILKAAA